MSSTTTTVSMNARRRSGNRGPTSASRPSAKAVSVDIATPQPCAGERPGVEEEIDRDGHRHAADPGEQGQSEPSSLAQLAEIELPPCLEPEDEEEERHPPAVHPLAQLERHSRPRRARSRALSPTASRTTTRRRSPMRAPRRPRPAGGGAARLSAQKLSQRRLDASRPAVRPENGDASVSLATGFVERSYCW